MKKLVWKYDPPSKVVQSAKMLAICLQLLANSIKIFSEFASTMSALNLCFTDKTWWHNMKANCRQELSKALIGFDFQLVLPVTLFSCYVSRFCCISANLLTSLNIIEFNAFLSTKFVTSIWQNLFLTDLADW